ncbi:YigZ family protein [Lachnospiraceae bacterium oral taxon 082 str. F0431]|jgi:YigZ family protein|uniref:YigZ family protein n=1 Tax=Lachnoanaerobaculum orale TaxID=979627 RepID=UPI00024702B8|nr:YigZ family protein [Lachnoanaerobaculum orale]EHO53686.1 YigZ family protein [Lachnospiraceae bacterium oral taxon 082 str. F0431]
MKIILETKETEIVEKKSRFIANIAAVSSEEEAIEFIEKIKKKYYDARHNCYAYIIGDKGDKKKCSDDGEPQRSAGMPMMEVLENQGYFDIVAVVTRYFGGTLLGVGGLIRAYQGAVIEGLNASVSGEIHEGFRAKYRFGYDFYGKIKYIAESENIVIEDTLFDETVTISLIFNDSESERLQKKLVEETNANIERLLLEKIKYITVDNKWYKEYR